MTERSWVYRNLDWLIAIAPGTIAFAIGNVSWALTAIFGGWDALSAAFYGMLGCLAAGVIAPFVILGMRRDDALMWFVVSPCVSVLGLLFGVLLLLAGFGEVCNECLS